MVPPFLADLERRRHRTDGCITFVVTMARTEFSNKGGLQLPGVDATGEMISRSCVLLAAGVSNGILGAGLRCQTPTQKDPQLINSYR